MTLDDLTCYDFEFPRNFAGFCRLGSQQRLNEWRQTRIVRDGRIVCTSQRCIDFGNIAGRFSGQTRRGVGKQAIF